MGVSEMEQIGYRSGIDFAITSIEKAMDNPALDILTPRQVLGILVASLRYQEEEE